MREFFNGWRRKVGVFTLLLTCLLTCGWFRSQRAFEVINCPIGGEFAIAAASWNDALAIRCGWDTEDRWRDFVWHVTDDDYFEYTDPVSTLYRFDQPIPDGSGCFVRWCLLWREGGIGVSPMDQTPNRKMMFLIAPYGALIFPATLLSAYLLLWKPRKRIRVSHA